MNFGTGFLVWSVAGVVSINGPTMGFKSPRSENYSQVCQLYTRIQTISDEKGSRSAAQKKIDSQLLYALKQKRGETRGVPTERIEIELDRKGRALVDITASVTPEVRAKIRKLGGQVISDDARYHIIRARLALEKLEALASRRDVSFISPAAQAMNNNVRPN
jgi:hypothetical protein